MPDALSKANFTLDDLPTVQSFDCGSEPWELEVSNWLKGPPNSDCAAATIQKGSKVWLYGLDSGRIVGFGSLGTTEWRWTGKKDPYVPLSVILSYGVHKDFKKQPPSDDPNNHYSGQILGDLIEEAIDLRDTKPILGLCVDGRNTKAIHLYKRFQFADLSPWTNKDTGVSYNRMGLVLNGPLLTQLIEQGKKKKK